jgi:hypothetical protein
MDCHEAVTPKSNDFAYLEHKFRNNTMKHLLKQLLLSASIALLASCSSQESANTDAVANNHVLTATKTVADNENGSDASANNRNSSLLSSLSKLYPNGQLPANRTGQAGQDLLQNPTALLLTSAVPSAAIQQQAGGTLQPQALSADFQPVQRVQNTTLYGAYFFSIYPTSH